MKPNEGPKLVLLLFFTAYFVGGEHVTDDREMYLRKGKPPDGSGLFLQRKTSHTEKRFENFRSRSRKFQNRAEESKYIAGASSDSSKTDTANLAEERKPLNSKDEQHSMHFRMKSDSMVNDKRSSRDLSLRGRRMNDRNLRSVRTTNYIERQHLGEKLKSNRRLRMAVQRSDGFQSERWYRQRSKSVPNLPHFELRSREYVRRSLKMPIRSNTYSLPTDQGSSNRRSESFRSRLNTDRRRQEQRARSAPEHLKVNKRISKFIRNNIETREKAELNQNYRSATLRLDLTHTRDRRSRSLSLPSKRRTESLPRYERVERNPRSTVRSFTAGIKQKEVFQNNHKEQRTEFIRKIFRVERREESMRREHNRGSLGRRSESLQHLVNHYASDNLVRNRYYYRVQSPAASRRSYLTIERKLEPTLNRIRRGNSLFYSSLSAERFRTPQPLLNLRSIQNRLSSKRRFEKSELKTRSNKNHFATSQKQLGFSQINAKSQTRAVLTRNNAVNRNRGLAGKYQVGDKSLDPIQNRWDAQRIKRSNQKIIAPEGRLVQIRNEMSHRELTSERRLQLDQRPKSSRVQRRASVLRFEQHGRLASGSAVGRRSVQKLLTEHSSKRVLRSAKERRSEQERGLISEHRSILGTISNNNHRLKAIRSSRSKSFQSVTSEHRPEIFRRKLSESIQSLAQKHRSEAMRRFKPKSIPRLASKKKTEFTEADRIYRLASELVRRLAHRSKSELAKILATKSKERSIRIHRSINRRMEALKKDFESYRGKEIQKNRERWIAEYRSKPIVNTFTMDRKIKLVQERKRINRRVDAIPISLRKTLPVLQNRAPAKQAERKSEKTEFLLNKMINLMKKSYFALKSGKATEPTVEKQWDQESKLRRAEKETELNQHSLKYSKSEPISQNKISLVRNFRKDQPALDTNVTGKRNGRGYRGRDNVSNRFLQRVKRQSNNKQIELMSTSRIITNTKQSLDTSENRNSFYKDLVKQTLKSRNHQMHDIRIQMALKQKPSEYGRLDSEGYFNVQLGNIVSFLINGFLGFHILATISGENGGDKTKNLYGKLKNALLLKAA